MTSPPRIRTYRSVGCQAILDVLSQGDRLRDRFDHALIATLRFAGIRLGELVGLRLAELDLVRGRRGCRAREAGGGWSPVPEVPGAILDRYLVEVRPVLAATRRGCSRTPVRTR